MRWKSDKPKQGDWRVKTRFAWLPVTTTLPDKETVIWLERYQTNDRYEYCSLAGAWVGEYGWYTKQIAPMGYWDKK